MKDQYVIIIIKDFRIILFFLSNLSNYKETGQMYVLTYYYVATEVE